jgi:hypothetical protein
MSYISRKGFAPTSHDEDAALLRALFAAYSDGDYRYHGNFDEYSISANAAYERPTLLPALLPIEPRLTSRYGFLTPRTVRRVRDWLARIECREIDGLVLTKDRIGWCYVAEVER